MERMDEEDREIEKQPSRKVIQKKRGED